MALRSVDEARIITEVDGADGGVQGGEEAETNTFFFQYLARRAHNDAKIAEKDAQVIQTEAGRATNTAAVGRDSTDAATNVACRLADIGEMGGLIKLWGYGWVTYRHA